MTVLTNVRRAKPPEVKRGRIKTPQRILLYGVEGIGKSTFASQAPAPIFIGSEEGTNELDVERLEEATSWDAAVDQLHYLGSEPHNWNTVVLDTVDVLEILIHAKICKESGKKSIGDFDYGRGYVAALNEFHLLTNLLDHLRKAKGMGVILLGHARVRRFDNPEGDDYDRYKLTLHEGASDFLRGWSDMVLFANYETFVSAENDRAKAFSSGARVLYTEWRAAFDAKNRHGLPFKLPLSWDAFAAAMAAPRDVAGLLEDIECKISQLNDEKLIAQVRASIAQRPGDAARLAEINNRLALRIMDKGE